ncbi:hypothetical protein U1701_13030 [Sphingomonas sp. PB2P19]
MATQMHSSPRMNHAKLNWGVVMVLPVSLALWTLLLLPFMR